LRHWGHHVFGLGVLMVAAAYRPWLRFETMLFATVEKCFIAYLFPAISATLGDGLFRAFVATPRCLRTASLFSE